MLQLRFHPAEGVTALADAKSAFKISALVGFQSFLVEFLSANVGILWRLAKFGAIQVDPMFFVVLSVLTSAENRIRKHLNIPPCQCTKTGRIEHRFRRD